MSKKKKQRLARKRLDTTSRLRFRNYVSGRIYMVDSIPWRDFFFAKEPGDYVDTIDLEKKAVVIYIESRNTKHGLYHKVIYGEMIGWIGDHGTQFFEVPG